MKDRGAEACCLFYFYTGMATSWTPAVGGLFVCECMCESVCPRS